jgi:predicted Zn-dependent protease with MMP-like domain
MTSGEFDQIVERAFARIPARFRNRMKNVTLVVESEPPPMPGGRTLLGLYQGRPLTRRSVFESFGMPDRITIFQGPHERLARTPAHLEKLVEDTVWHEVAHYFGMDEFEVRAAERRRQRRATIRPAGPGSGTRRTS